MSFANKIIGSSNNQIHFITCKGLDDRDCFYFLSATSEKIKMLKKLNGVEFDLNDYGKILAAGYGLTPSEQVKSKLREEYGFDANSLL
jgi:hypothetical protein